MDCRIFSQSLWRSEQEEPFSIQGGFSRKLQAANCKSSFAVNQQVFGVYETRKIESEVRKGTAKEFFGKRNQRCRL